MSLMPAVPGLLKSLWNISYVGSKVKLWGYACEQCGRTVSSRQKWRHHRHAAPCDLSAWEGWLENRQETETPITALLTHITPPPPLGTLFFVSGFWGQTQSLQCLLVWVHHSAAVKFLFLLNPLALPVLTPEQLWSQFFCLWSLTRHPPQLHGCFEWL